MANYGNPDYSKAGGARDALAARNVVAASNSVRPKPTRSDLDSSDLFALVNAKGEITPVALSSLLTLLEATYVLTPQP